ncbi:MAG: cytochrome c biogenesis protein CcsA [Pirellulaceae bacterium]|nr:cytochrome c biogenesis protein CcsA [Pirellulaceae bacterium]
MLSQVHIVCFAASYLVALVLEVSRLFLRVSVRTIVGIGFTAAGLSAHTIYLVLRGSRDAADSPPLSSWYDWLLLAAWGVAAVYLVAAIRRPQAALGIFMLPVVLVLVGVAHLFRDVPPFPREHALTAWSMIHGIALLLGVVAVTLGFVAGIMYLVHSYRLKHKLPPRQGLRLPSLEWLQRANRQALIVSPCLVGIGLLSGVVMNLLKSEQGMGWSDPVVWTSGVLLAWLVLVLIFEMTYKPVQQGRKVAYLTVASFVFLALVLAIVLLVPSGHASVPPHNAAPPASAERPAGWDGGGR